MLYSRIDCYSDFLYSFPKSRQKSYSYEGLYALYEYWDRKADEEDIKVDETLDYPCCEYDSAIDAVNDYSDDIDSDIYWDMVNDYLMDKDIDIDDVEDWQQYIPELDEDEVTEKCIEFLEDCSRIDYVEELDNGHVFIVDNER